MNRCARPHRRPDKVSCSIVVTGCSICKSSLSLSTPVVYWARERPDPRRARPLPSARKQSPHRVDNADTAISWVNSIPRRPSGPISPILDTIYAAHPFSLFRRAEPRSAKNVSRHQGPGHINSCVRPKHVKRAESLAVASRNGKPAARPTAKSGAVRFSLNRTKNGNLNELDTR